jgi:hypothetical protein
MVLDDSGEAIQAHERGDYVLISGGGMSSVGPASIPWRSLLWRTL